MFWGNRMTQPNLKENSMASDVLRIVFSYLIMVFGLPFSAIGFFVNLIHFAFRVGYTCFDMALDWVEGTKK